MKRAWSKTESLITSNAKHRKGWRTQEMDLPYLLKHATEELQELVDAPDDPTEMADLLAILFHYAIKQGWTMQFLESLMIEKMNLRFSE